jgi:peptidoglycan/LPS O-acetylase OafA/YrhL
VLIPPLNNPVSGFLLNGSLDVSVFFVLSGDALSTPYFNGGGDRSVVKLAIKRYTRLTMPILCTCLIVLLIYKLDLVHNIPAGKVVSRQDWLGSWLNYPLDLLKVLKYSLFDVYVDINTGRAVNPFLWTMQIELIGSAIVFAVLLIFSRIPAAWLLLLALAFAALAFSATNEYANFLFGISFSAARSYGVFGRLHANWWAQLLSWLAAALVGTITGYLTWRGQTHGIPALAVMLVFAIFCNRTLCGFFSSRFSQMLGKLSFPMYLMQFVVLISLTSALLLFAAERKLLSVPIDLTIAAVSLIATLTLAILFEPIEIATRWVGNALVRLAMPIAKATLPARTAAAAQPAAPGDG